MFDHDAFLLSLVGSIPIVGDIVKDQFSAKMSQREMERVRQAIERLSKRILSQPAVPIAPEKRQALGEFIEKIVRQVAVEVKDQKRQALVELLARSLENEADYGRLDFVARLVEKISDIGLIVLGELDGKFNVSKQLHSHRGILAEMQSRFGYYPLVSVLKELDSLGLIHFDANYSIMSSDEAQFTVWWRGLGPEFLDFIKLK